jgi:hypothetical protein
MDFVNNINMDIFQRKQVGLMKKQTKKAVAGNND